MPEAEVPETPPAPEAPIPHVTCPVVLPNLDGLTVPELQTLRTYMHGQSREARKKSVQTMSKIPELHKLWLDTLKSGLTHDERERAMALFHSDLARHPEAFVKYMFANSLIVLSEMIRDDMLLRAGEVVSKKKPSGVSRA